jgi:hypothetical protein
LQHVENTTEFLAKIEGARLAKLDPRIVPDARWPDMYRIKKPDGTLSDMVNLTRARDALRVLDERILQ